MKLANIYEMTMRTGADMDNMPFPDFDNQELTFEGKMEGGLEVYSFHHNNTTIYGVKIKDVFVSFTQTRTTNIPNYGKVVETLNTKTLPEFRNQKLSFKLKFFLNKHLGLPLVLGNIHSVATENSLTKISHLFDMFMINIKTGEIVPWSEKVYKQLTHIAKTTDWQVLMQGNKPLKEDVDYYTSWSDDNRHVWTYGDYFRGVDVVDDML